MYNRRDLSRSAVERTLSRRTAVLRAVKPSEAAFRAATARLATLEAPPVFASVRVCSLLGFLDGDPTRVGCLGHPAATGGLDLRPCGAYEPGICEGFTCASHGSCTAVEADLLCAVCAGDPFIYGLVATDLPFARAVLRAVEALAGGRVEERQLGDRRFRDCLAAAFALKEALAPGSEGLFAAFRAPAAPGASAAASGAGGREAALEEVLSCLGADDRSGNDGDALEEEARRRLVACAAAIPRSEAGVARSGRFPERAVL